MPLTAMYGKGGSGKNTILAYLMAKFFQKYMKYCNYTLRLPNVKKVNTFELFEMKSIDIKEIIFVLYDEAYTEGLDNRNSLDLLNEIQSYLLFQARKKNYNIISIAQLNMLDIRWRELEENYIYCFPRPIYTYNQKKDTFEHYTGDFHYAYVNGRRKPKKFTLHYKDALKVFPLFETKQTILPKNFEDMKKKQKLTTSKGKLEYIQEITDLIEHNFSDEILEGVTHDKVKAWMLELELTDFSYERYVYVKLKQLCKKLTERSNGKE